jgi:hypothetical protein
MQPAPRQHGGMLQIALAPASIANREIGQGRRALLIAARQRRDNVNRSATAPQKRGLDKIVAGDVSAERFLAA